MRLRIERKHIDPQRVAFASTVIADQVWGPAYGPLLGRVLEHLDCANVRPTAPPFARFTVFVDRVELDAGIPVKDAPEAYGIRIGELPGGDAAIGRHIGPPSELGTAHEAVRSWINQRGFLVHAFWEIYLTDARIEPDERHWQTDIVYLIR
jgi:effector-binding domain-containing protein